MFKYRICVWLGGVIFIDTFSSTLDLSTKILSAHFAQVCCIQYHAFWVCVVVLAVSIWSLISNTNGQAKELPTYKDNDFINDGQKIYINEENKKMFLEKLRKDVEVCVRHEFYFSCQTVIQLLGCLLVPSVAFHALSAVCSRMWGTKLCCKRSHLMSPFIHH